MGWLKQILKRFACNSKCTFNSSDFDKELVDIDLSKYKLKINDLIAIDKIIRKRPSIHTYKHDKKDNIDNITEV